MKKNMRIIIAFVVLAIGVMQPAFSDEDERAISRIERQMIAEGKYQESFRALEGIADEKPSARIWLDMGLALYGVREYDRAREYFNKAKEMRSSAELKDMITYALSKTEENRDLLDRIEVLEHRLDSSNPEEYEEITDQLAGLHFVAINVLVENKHYYPALVVPHIRWLKENMKELDGIHLLSADVLYTAMFYKEASEDYLKAIEEDSDNARVSNTLADCLVAMGDYSTAGKYYNRTIELYLAEGMAADAPEIMQIEKVKEAFPGTYDEVTDLLSGGRYYEAEKICKRRISLNAGDVTAIIQLGQVYWATDRRKQAIKLFRKAVKIAPDYPFGYFYVGKAYIFERKVQKAMKNFDLFMGKMENAEDKDESTIDAYVSALHYISHIYFIYGTKEEALSVAQKAAELRPEDQQAHYNLAVIYYQKFYNRPKAYMELQKVIEIEPISRMGDMAKAYIDYMRRNPDSRVIGDFSILYEE